MLLRRVMGTPLLSWLAASLKDLGVCRCLLVCSDALAEEAAACFPPQITARCAAPGSDAIREFLSAEDGNALLITGPAVFVPGNAILTDEDRTDAPTGVCLAACSDLLAELDCGSDLASLAECCGSICTEQDGFFAVSSPDELADWQPILKRMLLYELAEQGVEIWDYDNCYIAPSVQIGAGTEILPGVILRGRTVIGKNCTIGPNSLLEHAEIGDGVKVNASQIYESSVGAKTTVGPFAYIRPNCRIGSDVRIGDFVEIKNSVIGWQGTNTIGFGEMLLENTTCYCDHMIGFRYDYGCTWHGNLTIRNVTWVPHPGRTFAPTMLHARNDGQHDFGYPVSLPTHILIENVTVVDTNVPRDYAGLQIIDNFNPSINAENADTFDEPFGLVRPETLTIRGLHCVSGKKPIICPNMALLPDMKITIED